MQHKIRKITQEWKITDRKNRGYLSRNKENLGVLRSLITR